MSRIGGYTRGRARRRRRPVIVEIALALFCVAMLGYVVIDQGRVQVPGLETLLSRFAPDTLSRSFALCSGSGGTCVVDGDTIRIDGRPIRIADIDTPEVRGYACPAEKALGDRATQRMIELLNAGPFALSRYDHRDTDVYGRQLRIVTRDGQSLGMTLVAEGLARPWDGARRSWC